MPEYITITSTPNTISII